MSTPSELGVGAPPGLSARLDHCSPAHTATLPHTSESHCLAFLVGVSPPLPVSLCHVQSLKLPDSPIFSCGLCPHPCHLS